MAVVFSILKKALSNKLSSVETVAETTPSRLKATARKSMTNTDFKPTASPNSSWETSLVLGRTRSTTSSVDDEALIKQIKSESKGVSEKNVADNTIERTVKEEDGQESAVEMLEPIIEIIEFPDSDSDHCLMTEDLADDSQSPASETSLTCVYCSKIFRRKYNLVRHLNSYPCDGLPLRFTCEFCNRSYNRKDNLQEHLRTHTAGGRDKKYKCDYCGKAFHGMSLLTIHKRIHTGEKPFHCDVCPKRFPSADALKKHKRTHTGERPYVCPECGFDFALKGTLKRHLRLKHWH